MTVRDLLVKLGVLLYAVSYRYCYLTGLWTMGALSRAGRALYLRLRAAERAVGSAAEALLHRVLEGLRGRLRGLRRWRAGAGRAFASLGHGCRALLCGHGAAAARLTGHGLAGVWRALLPVARTAVNWGLPVVAALLLLRVVGDWSARDYALRVRYGSDETGYTDFGYIADESVYDEAVREVAQKMGGAVDATDFSARFELEAVPPGQEMLDPYTLSDSIILSSGLDVETAYGLYVDGDLIDAVRDKDALLSLLAVMQDRYKTGDPTETVRFIRDVALREGLYPKGRIANLSAVNQKIGREVRGEFVYEAQEGDSASLIAQKFDVPLAQIVANNPDITTSLFVGDKVLISRAQPYLAVQIQRLETYTENVAFPTEAEEDASLLKGQTRLLRDGVPGVDRVRAAVTYENGVETDRQVVRRERVVDPISELVAMGSKMFMQNYGGGKVTANFIHPVPGMRYVSNYFNSSTAFYSHHGALDFAANYGTPIYASAPGTVVYSAYTAYGYGHHIIINHGGGYETLYAHMSSRVARVGDVVDQGQIIGYVGSTGLSTGNHCHFEIRVNGVPADPLPYLG